MVKSPQSPLSQRGSPQSPFDLHTSSSLIVTSLILSIRLPSGDLAAFVDGELRGIARPSSYTAPVGSYKGYKSYNLMAYGQLDTEGATVTFQYRHADGRVSALPATVSFAKDAFLGSVQEPFVIDAIAATSGPAPMLNANASPTAALPAVESERQFSFLSVCLVAAPIVLLLTIALCAVRRAADLKALSAAQDVLPAKVVAP